jgi:hypothetical protein
MTFNIEVSKAEKTPFWGVFSTQILYVGNLFI